MQRFDYLEPKTVEEASALLGEKENRACLLAGGTDLVVKLKEDQCRPEALISLSEIPGLKGITFDSRGNLTLGSMVTHAEVTGHPQIRKAFPLLADACLKVGSQQIRNRGTLGGNVCNASPAADTAPALLVYEAQASVVGPGGRRRIPLEKFFMGPGKTALGKGEILENFSLPASTSSGVYIKHSIRKAMDLPIIGVAVLFRMEDLVCRQVRVALGAVAPVPFRAVEVERLLEGQRLADEWIAKAGEAAVQAISPISDIRSSAEYRREMVRVLTKRALRQAAGK